jgi:hypothetical protein
MKIIKNKQFPNESDKWYFNHRGGSIENLRFEKCTFGGEKTMRFAYGIRNPSDVFIIRNCEFINCTFYDQFGGLSIGQAIIENVLIQNCKTKGSFGLTLKQTLLRHVTIKGKFNRFTLSTFGNEFEREERYQMVSAYKELYDENSDFSACYETYGGTQYLHLEEALTMKNYFVDFYKNTDNRRLSYSRPISL